MSSLVKIGGIYRHYKNKQLYRVIQVAKHHETVEDIVIYKALYKNPLSQYWIRPKLDFIGNVYNYEGQLVKRFTLQEK